MMVTCMCSLSPHRIPMGSCAASLSQPRRADLHTHPNWELQITVCACITDEDVWPWLGTEVQQMQVGRVHRRNWQDTSKLLWGGSSQQGSFMGDKGAFVLCVAMPANSLLEGWLKVVQYNSAQ